MKARKFFLLTAVVFVGATVCMCAVPAETAPAASSETNDGEIARKDAPAADPIAAIDEALKRGSAFLETAASEKDGSYGVMLKDEKGEQYFGDVGITALVVSAIARSPYGGEEMKKDYFKKAVKFLEDNVQQSGAIANPGAGLENYRTSISAMALADVDAKKYADIIRKAQEFVKTQQFNEDGKIAVDNPYYGGIGYGSKTRPDLSNTQWALESLKETGLDPNDPVFKKAVTFLQRCQNNTETNDHDRQIREIIPVNDGGARYAPYESKVVVDQPDGKQMLLSYGSMTYAFLKSMIYAGVDREDPRMRAAFRWILINYSLDKNPGFSTKTNKSADKQGLYYYYHTMSKALLLYGRHVLATPDGGKHNWALELSQKIIGLQDKDGFWVNPYEERWYEGNPPLVTAYSMAVLSNCREEILRQREFLAETPGHIDGLNNRITDIRKQIEAGKMDRSEGETEISELQQEINALTETLNDLRETPASAAP